MLEYNYYCRIGVQSGFVDVLTKSLKEYLDIQGLPLYGWLWFCFNKISNLKNTMTLQDHLGTILSVKFLTFLIVYSTIKI